MTAPAPEGKDVLTREAFTVALGDFMILAMEDVDVGRDEAGELTIAKLAEIGAHDLALRAQAAADRETIRRLRKVLREQVIHRYNCDLCVGEFVIKPAGGSPREVHAPGCLAALPAEEKKGDSNG